MHYLEAAAAAMLEASHFVSFDPEARLAARMAGLTLLPKSIEN